MKKFLLAMFLVGCGHLSAQDDSDLAQYQIAQTSCIAAFQGDEAQIDSCRASVKREWATHWNARFDGGFGQ